MDMNPSVISALFQNLRKDFEKGITEANIISTPLVEKVPSTGDSNVYSWLGHIAGMKEWYKGQPRVLRNIESFDFTVRNRKFENTIPIYEDDLEDEQLPQYSQIAKRMGIESKLLVDQLVFELFDNAFNSSYPIFDGKAWCADNHVIGQSTIDNKRTATLAESSLEEAIRAITAFQVQPDKLSKARPLNPTSKLMLVVPPALQTTAEKLVTLPLVSGGSSNYLYKKAEVLVSPWLTSTTAWFLVNVGASIKPIFVQERKKPEFRTLTPKDSDLGFMNDSVVFGVKARMAALPTVPWLVIGSTGESAT